jgi:hypothetical protein
MADSPRKPPCGTTLTLGAVGALAAVSAYQGRRGSGSRAPEQKPPPSIWTAFLMTGLAAADLGLGPALPFPGSGTIFTLLASKSWIDWANGRGVSVPDTLR